MEWLTSIGADDVEREDEEGVDEVVGGAAAVRRAERGGIEMGRTVADMVSGFDMPTVDALDMRAADDEEEEEEEEEEATEAEEEAEDEDADDIGTADEDDAETGETAKTEDDDEEVDTE
jgi:hypothetical protein